VSEVRAARTTVRAGSGDDRDREFCLRLTRAHMTVTRRLDNVLSGLHGLSFSDFVILHYLERAPGRKLRRVDLAERLGPTASGATRSLIPMEKLGLVSRESDPRDARVGFAVLIDSGRQLLTYAASSVQTVAAEATAAVSTERMDELSTLLKQLAGMNSSNS
jgi:DNA-binding MarR family transcriptional regulator